MLVLHETLASSFPLQCPPLKQLGNYVDSSLLIKLRKRGIKLWKKVNVTKWVNFFKWMLIPKHYGKWAYNIRRVCWPIFVTNRLSWRFGLLGTLFTKNSRSIANLRNWDPQFWLTSRDILTSSHLNFTYLVMKSC